MQKKNSINKCLILGVSLLIILLNGNNLFTSPIDTAEAASAVFELSPDLREKISTFIIDYRYLEKIPYKLNIFGLRGTEKLITLLKKIETEQNLHPQNRTTTSEDLFAANYLFLGSIVLCEFNLKYIFLKDRGVPFSNKMVEEIFALSAQIKEYLQFVELVQFQELAVPLYTLAEDFPQEHVKTFHDFLLFCAATTKEMRETIKTTEDLLYLSLRKAITPKIIPVYEHPLVKMRLELNNPVRYEDFLAAVILSISWEHYIGYDYYCALMFPSPTRVS